MIRVYAAFFDTEQVHDICDKEPWHACEAPDGSPYQNESLEDALDAVNDLVHELNKNYTDPQHNWIKDYMYFGYRIDDAVAFFLVQSFHQMLKSKTEQSIEIET